MELKETTPQSEQRLHVLKQPLQLLPLKILLLQVFLRQSSLLTLLIKPKHGHIVI